MDASNHDSRQQNPRRRGPAYSDFGVVLRSYRLGESDKLLRIMTREHGKRSAVAKGVRRTGSKFGASLELLTCSRLLVHSGRNLDTVRQAQIENSFQTLREDLDLFMYASAMAELVDGAMHEKEPHPEVFDLLVSSLGLLAGYPARASFLLAFFDFKVLSVTGYQLHVTACSACGEVFEERNPLFSLGSGGLVCPACRSGGEVAGRTLRLKGETVSLLAWMVDHQPGQWPEAVPAPGVRAETMMLMDKVVEYWTEREFRCRKVMRAVPGPAGNRRGRGQSNGPQHA